MCKSNRDIHNLNAKEFFFLDDIISEYVSLIHLDILPSMSTVAEISIFLLCLLFQFLKRKFRKVLMIYIRTPNDNELLHYLTFPSI